MRGSYFWRLINSCVTEHYVIRFKLVSHKTAIDNNPLHACTPGEIDQPTQGFHLRLPKFGFLPETSSDILQRGTMNPRWQIAIVVKGWNHEPQPGWIVFRIMRGCIHCNGERHTLFGSIIYCRKSENYRLHRP